MSKAEDNTVIILSETPAQSIVSDTYSFFLAVALIGIGVYLASSAMEWLGFILVSLKLIGGGMMLAKRGRKTPQQAADYLRDEFGVTASPKASA